MVSVGTLGIRLAAVAAVAGIGVITLRAETDAWPRGNALAASDRSADVPAPATTAHREAPVLELGAITLTSAETPADLVLPRVDAAVTRVATPQTPSVPAFGNLGSAFGNPQPEVDCTPQAAARPVAAAMVELTLQAPCLPDERVTVHHNGMTFSEMTSGSGAVTLMVPALSRDAVFILAFPDGGAAVAHATVEGLTDYDRAVLQWKGSAGLQVHAREFGADYGDRGHIWQDAPGDRAAAVVGESGFLTLLGDGSVADPMLAQVYTFPRSASEQAGAVALSVETQVGVENCGRQLEAQTLELQAEGSLRARTLQLTVPECDAAGSFLVLNNLLQDLKVAAR